MDDGGTLRFAWWEGNERLKGEEVVVEPDPHGGCYLASGANVVRGTRQQGKT